MEGIHDRATSWLRVIVNDEGFLYMKFFGSSDDKLKS